MKSNSEIVLAATAHHEAGHAVAAWRLKVPIKSLTIVPADDALGMYHTSPDYYSRARPGDHDTPRGQRMIEHTAIVCFAGPIAERTFSRGSRWRAGAREDHRTAIALLRYRAEGRALGYYVKYIRACAENLIENNWARVQHLAACLLRDKTLDREEVLDAMRYDLKKVEPRQP